MKIRLSEGERERLGCPEVLECHTDPLTVREAEALEAATGLEPLDAAKLMLATTREVPDDPTKMQYRLTPQGVRLRVWLGLFRAGITTDYDTLDFDYYQFAGWQTIDKALVDGGKAASFPESEPSMASKSARSGRRTSSRTSKK